MSDTRVTALQRRQVEARANARCEYCCSPSLFSSSSYHIEHIIPRVKNGSTTLDNLAFSCSGCNSSKHTQVEREDPLTGKIVRLFHPRQDDWLKHFMWNTDLLRLVGLTSIGRATIAALKLNRVELTNLRYALHAVGEHSPESY